MARRRKRTKLHPLLREVRKRQIEISKLLASARMLGIDPTPIMPSRAAPVTRKSAERYYRDMIDAFAPLEYDGPPLDHGNAKTV